MPVWLGLLTLTLAADVDYSAEIKPLLARRCYSCHGALQQQNGLRLDTAEHVRKGGESGPAVEKSEPAKSLLIQVLTGEAGFRMPPANEGTPLTEAEIGLLKKWIAAGAQGPPNEEPQPDPQRFWSYLPVARPPIPDRPPAIDADLLEHSPIDRFVHAKQHSLGLIPASPAPRATWLRRVYLDLVGLPPMPDEQAEFLDDSGPDAAARVVDRLVARPEHGERWGRHWMDVWRYSDWYGSRAINEIRYSQRHIWRWRDWIVRSVNHDLPYRDMIEQMLAGDELSPADPDVLAATGFLGRNWYKFDRNVWMFETIEQTSQAFLAATLRCARCHDHKFDPLTQEEYYRFRAVFEPHDVRTDPLSSNMTTEKDATLGPVLVDGVARVFDKQIDVPTYVFQRGDPRYPDEKRRVEPGVPAAFRAGQLAIQSVALPAEAYYPALRAEIASSLLAKADADIEATRKRAEDLVAKKTQLEARLREAEAAATSAANPAASSPTTNSQPAALPSAPPSTSAASAKPALRDDFSQARPDAWKALGGKWECQNGRLVQSQVTSFATMVSQTNHPQNFQAKLRYRTLPAGTIRSVGFSFDYVDQGNSQDVYTSTGDARQSVQAFHRIKGQQVYPPAGIVPVTLKTNDETTVEVTVRGPQLVIVLNGQEKLRYALPVPRREGRFALWVHDGTAEFLGLEIHELIPNVDDLRLEVRQASHEAELQQLKIETARAEHRSLAARIEAERARLSRPDDVRTPSIIQAARTAERQVAVAKRAEEVLSAEHALDETRRGGAADAVTAAEQKRAAARDALEAARAQVDSTTGDYSPVGAAHPATSTGRRLALARWIASPTNPRTARVAVNHVWLRHFGQAIVPSVANFGLNGDRPSHPELLDWLADEFMRHDWEFKRLHRELTLSATYALTSASGPADAANRQRDAANRYLWRANARRMEAEVVRDSVLAAANLLQRRLGGPELPEKDGLAVHRRSLYFRATPNEKMKFLELFDAADPNACYRRRESVVPQQSLALMNSRLALDAARTLAAELTTAAGPPADESSHARFVAEAWRRILGRAPDEKELAACRNYLDTDAASAAAAPGTPFSGANAEVRPPSTEPRQRARENLILVLFSHNDFVTVR